MDGAVAGKPQRVGLPASTDHDLGLGQVVGYPIGYSRQRLLLTKKQ